MVGATPLLSSLPTYSVKAAFHVSALVRNVPFSALALQQYAAVAKQFGGQQVMEEMRRRASENAQK